MKALILNSLLINLVEEPWRGETSPPKLPNKKQKSQVYWASKPYSNIIHGLRTRNETSFHQNTKLLGFGRQFGQINFGAFGVFSVNLSAPIFFAVSPLSMFSINQIFIWDWDLNLAIVCPQSMLSLLWTTLVHFLVNKLSALVFGCNVCVMKSDSNLEGSSCLRIHHLSQVTLSQFVSYIKF